MPSIKAVRIHYYAGMSGHTDLFVLLEQGLCSLYESGFSVVEIARLLGDRSADYAHGVLVKNGRINPAKRGRQKKDIVPKHMGAYLRWRRLSFGKWCAGWTFDPVKTSTVLKEGADDDEAQPVWEAVRRDFPRLYTRLRGIHNPEFLRPPVFDVEKLECSVIWDEEHHCYRAVAMDNVTLKGYGPSLEEAVSNLKITANISRKINRIKKITIEIS